ncbi:hypothetical protein SBA4_960032 [Candidatus Sulfopaludibacter sp. SbA4]|nr:hypothetical protein SBA4_960032 [Candidatus Sulfopaludibacter sp. SbA4]
MVTIVLVVVRTWKVVVYELNWFVHREFYSAPTERRLPLCSVWRGTTQTTAWPAIAERGKHQTQTG